MLRGGSFEGIGTSPDPRQVFLGVRASSDLSVRLHQLNIALLVYPGKGQVN